MRKLTTPQKIFNIFNSLLMILLVVITLYPLWFVMVASFSDNTAVIKSGGFMLWFKNFTPAAYKEVLKFSSVWKGYRNTIFVVLVGTTLNIIMTAIGGYFLSRKNVLLQKYFAIAVVITMYFQGGMIPRYFVVKNLGLYNSLFSIIFPVLVSTYNMIIMRAAFAAVPDSLEESAKIDGARHFTILFKIMFPLCMPTIAVLILYYAVGHWNGWFEAMLYLKDRDKFPLQLVLREIVLNNSGQENNMVGSMDKKEIGETIQYAVIVVATMPILCVYPFLQRYFEKGVMIGAVKG